MIRMLLLYFIKKEISPLLIRLQERQLCLGLQRLAVNQKFLSRWSSYFVPLLPDPKPFVLIGH